MPVLTNDPPAGLKPEEIYSVAMNNWLEHNGSAPMLPNSGWKAHEVGLAAVAAAAKAEALDEVKARLPKTIGPVRCDADETGTFLDGMTRMREYIEAELDARAAEFRTPATAG
jgi:hypothetical protein